MRFNWKLVQVPPSLFAIFGANTDDLHRWVRIIYHRGDIKKKEEDYVFSCFGAAAKSFLCKVFLPSDVLKYS